MNKPIVVEMGPLGHSVVVKICFSEAAWRKAMPKDSLDRYDIYCKTPAECWLLRGEKTVLVCFDMKQMNAMSLASAVGLIAHEATHVAQFVATAIEEQGPLSDEVQAYVVQHVTAACWHHLPRKKR